ncbi:SGNH/GDSL hydrolase family protein [Quadrisphaera sp. GCM10027208]|uniref:SGNH/GDSL hydrolase family protein n=1 Tax=Quadrisphaera sp. GCM10027208 TaxID=3273423 RepID=UPI003607731A
MSPEPVTPAPDVVPRWHRYVALGDSFTEGMADPDPRTPGEYRGWADRLAEALHVRRVADGAQGLEYANLAVRGRLLDQILAEQLPVALDSGADLVSIVGGGNDVLRPGTDPDDLAARLEDAVRLLRGTGADVLMATGVDPRNAPLIQRTRGKVATYNSHIWSIASRHGARVIDLWGLRALRDWRLWADDRIHLSAEGHRRVAGLALHTLGLATGGEHAVPLDPEPPRPRLDVLRDDAAWVRGHVAPWLGRRLRGRSSGDGRTAKRPHPAPVEPVPLDPAPLDVRD